MGEGFLSQLAGLFTNQGAQAGANLASQAFPTGASTAFGNQLLSQLNPQMLASGVDTGAQVAGGGILDTLQMGGGGLLDLLKNESFVNSVKAGTGALGAFNQFQQAKKAGDLLDRQDARAEQAFRRDMEADEKRRLLNF